MFYALIARILWIFANAKACNKYSILFYFIFMFVFGFDRTIISGDLDHVPEVAFYMVGDMEEVISKAETLV